MNDDISKLLNIYDKIMVLNIFVTGDEVLKNKYISTTEFRNTSILANPEYIDAGFDLFLPSETIFAAGNTTKVDYKVKCNAQIVCDTGKQYNTGYYIHPRSSLSNTPLRLANSTGIIDASYRGNLIAKFDALNNHVADEYTRQIQLCAPGLIPIYVVILNDESGLGETYRGDGAFGSTGM